jgi:hypothetical protein
MTACRPSVGLGISLRLKAMQSVRTLCINSRYFFVTNRIASNKLSVEWCPTVEKIADFMTKPLQGALFKKFRDLIMGVISTKSPTQAQSTKVMTTVPTKTKKDGGCTQCGNSNVKTYTTWKLQ